MQQQMALPDPPPPFARFSRHGQTICGRLVGADGAGLVRLTVWAIPWRSADVRVGDRKIRVGDDILVQMGADHGAAEIVAARPGQPVKITFWGAAAGPRQFQLTEMTGVVRMSDVKRSVARRRR